MRGRWVKIIIHGNDRNPTGRALLCAANRAIAEPWQKKKESTEVKSVLSSFLAAKQRLRGRRKIRGSRKRGYKKPQVYPSFAKTPHHI